MGLTVALVLAEILNVVQVFTPAHAVTVCYCCYCCSAASKQKMAKNPGKTRKYLGFFRYFGYYPHWTLEIVVGHCQRARPSLLLFSRRSKTGPRFLGFGFVAKHIAGCGTFRKIERKKIVSSRIGSRLVSYRLVSVSRCPTGRRSWRQPAAPCLRRPPRGLGHRTRAATKHNVLPQSTTSDFARRA